MAKFHNCVAVQFDSTATYKFGEHVMYNDMLYKCIVDDYSAGEFSLDNFEQTYLANAVNVGNVIDENIAPSYNPELTYALGEYVLYNAELYVCTEPVITAEPFDSEKWERAYVSDLAGGEPVTTGYLDYIANEYDENTMYEIGNIVIYDGYMYECLESTTGEFDETMWKRTYISENVLRDSSMLDGNLANGKIFAFYSSKVNGSGSGYCSIRDYNDKILSLSDNVFTVLKSGTYRVYSTVGTFNANLYMYVYVNGNLEHTVSDYTSTYTDLVLNYGDKVESKFSSTESMVAGSTTMFLLD